MEYPELFHCYVGIGQVAHMTRNEMHSYSWTLEQARKRKDRRAIAVLEKMGPPPYTGNWQAKTVAERRYLARFGGEVYKSGSGAMKFVLPGLLFSREYSLPDRINVFRGVFGDRRGIFWSAQSPFQTTRLVRALGASAELRGAGTLQPADRRECAADCRRNEYVLENMKKEKFST